MVGVEATLRVPPINLHAQVGSHMLRRRGAWPTPSFEQIRKRARILVIDDQAFPYEALFARDGYSLTKEDDVSSLSDLEDGDYDLILLDLQGVGSKESSDEGLGVLRHLREVRPAQMVIAYSEATFGLKAQPFFRLADGVLQKSADYIAFKEKVDELLQSRFSVGFYVGRIAVEAGLAGRENARLADLAQRAIISGRPAKLRAFLKDKIDDKTIRRILIIIEAARFAASVWK